LDLREEVTGEWRKQHNGNYYNLYSSQIIKIIKLSRIRWEGYVAHMGRMKYV